MKMKKGAELFMAVTMIFLVTACGTQSGRDDFSSKNKATDDGAPYQEERQSHRQQPENQNRDEPKGQNAEAFDGPADLEGSVYDFTEAGFSLSPANTYEDGDGLVMEQAVPGAEDTSKLVTITYSEGYMFQLVVMDLSSLEEVSREDTTSESIKKQTQVKVYGNCQDTTHWTAEKIILVRWQ